MSTIEFNFEGNSTLIQCTPEEKITNIIERLVTKLDKKKEDLYFIYNGGMVKEDLTFQEQANKSDKESNKMSILVYAKDDPTEEEDESLKKSEYVICPKCKECARISVENYKFGLYDCKNGHKVNDISINDFEQTQNINEAKIVCQNCNQINKSTSYNNIFFICFDCKKNLCQLCKSLHDKSHNIIDYDDKFFTCDLHYESFYSYCEDCKKDLCVSCESEHGGHKILTYGSLLPNIKKLKEENNNFNTKIEKFKNDIKDIINKLNDLMHSIVNYYSIYQGIINSYGNKKRNYFLLQNINDINKFNKEIIENIDKITNNKNISTKFNDIFDIYQKMNTQNKANPNDAKSNIIINVNDVNLPKDIEIQDINSKTLKISWKLEEIKIDNIDNNKINFRVEIKKENSDELFNNVYEGQEKNCLIENLNKNTNYEIRICSLYDNIHSDYIKVIHRTDFFSESVILNQSDKNILLNWLNPLYQGKNLYMKLIYRRGNDLSYETFHAKCDNKGPTLVICKSKNEKFGGYTSVNWESNSNGLGILHSKSFIFSINKNKKYDHTNTQSHSIYLHKDHGPDFFWDLDFNSWDKKMGACLCATKAIGYAYSKEPLIGDGSTKEINVDEVEVFKVKSY